MPLPNIGDIVTTDTGHNGPVFATMTDSLGVTFVKIAREDSPWYSFTTDVVVTPDPVGVQPVSDIPPSDENNP